MKASGYIVPLCMFLLGGCASTSTSLKVSDRSADTADLASGNFALVSLCRDASAIRSAEAPDLRLNNTAIGQLGPGGRLSIKVKPNTEIDLFLSSNPLMYRFQEDVIYERVVARGEDLYLRITPERNVLQGVTVFFGGAAAESVRQGSAKQVGNWSVIEVKKEEFQNLCR